MQWMDMETDFKNIKIVRMEETTEHLDDRYSLKIL